MAAGRQGAQARKVKQEHLLSELRTAKERLNVPRDNTSSEQQEVLSSTWSIILAGVGVGLGLLVMGCDGTQAETVSADTAVGSPVASQSAECPATQQLNTSDDPFYME